MNTEINLKEKIDNALDFQTYLDDSNKKIEKPEDYPEETKLDIIKLNMHRNNRVIKTYKVSEELTSLLNGIKTPQTWMVITEDWCGDSSQNLPYIFKMSEVNPNITLKIVLRDSNLDVIDNYLTNGTRSIPKLIAFNEDWNEVFQWGPRPVDAQNVVNELKGEGLPKEEWLEKLHLWYGRNRGKAIEGEFINLLK